MFRIKKVLNVNVVLAEQDGHEYIAFGKGIGYRQKVGKNVNGPDKNCPVLPNAYGCHLNSRIIRSFISV
ncbi:CAT RNA binding domain-containing protein, partial [Lacticaseibacillus paracasei]|uniref:CAT RNA binding domain-containing protein n=1 Tax=Lacticaseibacillus paracasei TaxID=1597 RepID=UPI0023AAE797